MLKTSVIAFAMILSATLTGCAMMTGLSGTSASGEPAKLIGRAAFCDVAKPIRWSSKDTDETIIEAKEHNCVGKVLGCAQFQAAVCVRPALNPVGGQQAGATLEPETPIFQPIKAAETLVGTHRIELWTPTV